MNMFDPKDFLTLFQEGKVSPDTITADFTKALNEALAIQKKADEEAARKKAEEEAARKREELKAALEAAKAKTKMREADDLAARFTAFLKTHYGDVFTALGDDVPTITGEAMVQVMDESMKALRELGKLKANLEDLSKMFNNKNIDDEIKMPVNPFPGMPKAPVPTPPADPIEAFLRSNHLL